MKSELIIKEIFHISRPTYHNLAEDYQAGISTLEALQSQVTTTKQHGSMIVEDMTGKMIQFVKNVFTLKAVEGALQMDQETANWPILDEFALPFDSIKYNYKPAPLPVFYKGELIDPIHTNTALNGSIVEIEFTVCHWKIKDHDTFQASAEKITILRLGAVHHKTNYKCPHVNNDKDQPEKKKIHQDAQDADMSSSKASGSKTK
ncbi:hypothetical protein F4604DRAFT_1921684 [Suillus subluteus]|nr:hypothetical protein F4604DRAFT_1921684 [Suillus subluteus]